MRSKKIFISDIHLGAEGKQKKYNYSYDWLSKKNSKKLYNFLKFIYNKKDVAELIILGDLFDTWVCPVDIIPPTIDDIVTAKKNYKIIKILKALASHPEIDVEYIPGNHDMSVTKKDIDKYFPGMIYNQDSIYRSRNIYAEHGHRKSLFNAPDEDGVIDDLPLGYFISRLVATQTALTGNKKISYIDHIDDILKIIGINTLPETVFFSVLDEAKLNKTTPIVYRDKDKIKVIKASEIAEKYKYIYDKKITKNGRKEAILSILVEMGFLKLIADNIFDTENINIIINGHSHCVDFNKDSIFVKDRIFINTGSWCEENLIQTYAEIDVFFNKNIISVYQWYKNKPKLINQTEIFL